MNVGCLTWWMNSNQQHLIHRVHRFSNWFHLICVLLCMPACVRDDMRSIHILGYCRRNVIVRWNFIFLDTWFASCWKFNSKRNTRNPPSIDSKVSRMDLTVLMILLQFILCIFVWVCVSHIKSMFKFKWTNRKNTFIMHVILLSFTHLLASQYGERKREKHCCLEIMAIK